MIGSVVNLTKYHTHENPQALLDTQFGDPDLVGKNRIVHLPMLTGGKMQSGLAAMDSARFLVLRHTMRQLIVNSSVSTLIIYDALLDGSGAYITPGRLLLDRILSLPVRCVFFDATDRVGGRLTADEWREAMHDSFGPRVGIEAIPCVNHAPDYATVAGVPAIAKSGYITHPVGFGGPDDKGGHEEKLGHPWGDSERGKMNLSIILRADSTAPLPSVDWVRAKIAAGFHVWSQGDDAHALLRDASGG